MPDYRRAGSAKGAIGSSSQEVLMPEQSAEVKLLAYALYRLKILLGAHLGSQNTSPTELRVAAHLSYALHEEALAVLEDRNFDLEAALAKLDVIDGIVGTKDGSFLHQDFVAVLASASAPHAPGHE